MGQSYSSPTAFLLIFQSPNTLFHDSFTSSSKASGSFSIPSHQMGGFPCLRYFIYWDILAD